MASSFNNNITDSNDLVGESSTQYEDSNTQYHEALSGLSDVQEMALAILPIPSAILSIFGSACIIYMSLQSREKKTWTPYTRLLMGMSICDIVSSLTLAVAAFLRPQENDRVWTFGSAATCSAIGMLTQFSYSGLFYNSMLSLYFLLSTRFRLKNKTIAKLFEPFMHFVSLGFPIVTAVLGAVMGVYSTTTSELGCWVNDYPRGCIGEECLSITIGWYYFGMPFLMSFAIIGVCNVAILVFVRFKTRPKQLRGRRDSKPIGDLGDTLHSRSAHSKTGTDVNTTIPPSSYDDEQEGGGAGGSDAFLTGSNNSGPTTPQRDDSSSGMESSFRSLPSLSWGASFRKLKQSQSSSNTNINSSTVDSEVRKQQTKRLRLIMSQALLFVASFIFTAGWLGLLRIIESMAETPEDELRMVVQIYPLMVINAFMAPLQGLFNMLVFIRPKYLKWRNEYPLEKRTWVFQRCIFGPQVRPTIRYVHQKKPVQPGRGGADRTLTNKDTNVGLMMESRRDDEMSQFQSILEHEDDDIRALAANEKVVDNTPDFYFPRSMVSTLTASVVENDDDYDHNDHDDHDLDDYKRRRSDTYLPRLKSAAAAGKKNKNSGGGGGGGAVNQNRRSTTTTRLQSFVAPSGSSLEVISELSVSHFEAHPSSQDEEYAYAEEEDEDEESSTMSCDEDEDEEYCYYNDQMEDVEEQAPHMLRRQESNKSAEDRWSASSPPPRSPKRVVHPSFENNKVDPDSSDRWSADNSDRSPTPASPRTSRHRRVGVDGSINSSDNRSDSRWSAGSGGVDGGGSGNNNNNGSTNRTSCRPIQDMMVIPQRLVTEHSEIGVESLLLDDEQQEQQQEEEEASFDINMLLTSPTPTRTNNNRVPIAPNSNDNSVSSADTPLQPPTRRLSPSEIEIPDTPIL